MLKVGYVYALTPTSKAEKHLLPIVLLSKMDEYEAFKAEMEALKSEAKNPD
jgi:hypothetical protein